MRKHPSSRPQQSAIHTHYVLEKAGINLQAEGVVVLGVRGYFRDSMGLTGKNDAGIYDDAWFVVTPEIHRAFNANVDPSRWGWNRALGKPYAVLAPGIWKYRPGYHKGQYKAFRQAETVQVLRDPDGPDGRKSHWQEDGWFGINHHYGSKSSTSSWGCQTSYQFWEYRELLYGILADLYPDKPWDKREFTYLLAEYQGGSIVLPEGAPIKDDKPRFHAVGKMSTFGGPKDTGVTPSEGLAMVFPSNWRQVEEYFLPEQPKGTTGLARRMNPATKYLACRWDYTKIPKSELIKLMAEVTNTRTGKKAFAKPLDWGPHERTNRVADLSPGLADELGLKTDDVCEVKVF